MTTASILRVHMGEQKDLGVKGKASVWGLGFMDWGLEFRDKRLGLWADLYKMLLKCKEALA